MLIIIILQQKYDFMTKIVKIKLLKKYIDKWNSILFIIKHFKKF